MALARARRDGGMNYWPGFVDALSTLILSIIFLLSVFVIVQFYLTQEVTGKDTALNRLNAQIAQLSELLSLEKTGKLSLEEQLAQIRSSLATTEGERDRFKGLYEGIGSGAAIAQGKVNEISGRLGAQNSMGLPVRYSSWRRKFQARSPGCCASTDTPTCGRSTVRSSRTTGSFRPGARSRSCNTSLRKGSPRSASSPPVSANSNRSSL